MSAPLKQTGAVVRWEGGGAGGEEVRLVTMVATVDEAAAAVAVAIVAVAASTLVSRTVTSCSSRVTSPSSLTLTFASAGTCARAPACELCVEANKIEGQ